MSGGSRGIGLAIALRAARDGANIVLLAKTGEDHPKLAGTVYTAAQEVEDAGGRALPLVGDVRHDDDVARAVAAAVDRFGGIDVVINNASAIDLSRTDEMDMKRYDLMQDINVRGTFLLSKLALPALRAAEQGNILTLSPPLNLDPRWAGRHLAYTMAKYGMSLTTLGLAEELKADGIRVNSLWPCTLIDTAAIRNLPQGGQHRPGRAGAADHGGRRSCRPDRGAPGLRRGAKRKLLYRRTGPVCGRRDRLQRLQSRHSRGPAGAGHLPVGVVPAAGITAWRGPARGAARIGRI